MSIPSNNLRNPHKIRAGKYLIIPVGEGRGDPIASARVGAPQPLKVTSTDGRERNIYRVRKGDSLSEIAQKFNVRIADLRSWNSLWGKRFIYPGQNLVVWTKADHKKNEESSKFAMGPPAPESSTISGNQVHVVQSGDTLWDIAQLYGISVRDLMKWNKISSARRLMPGIVLRLQP
jgi:membrane-bound lytic murein transglycosylase D